MPSILVDAGPLLALPNRRDRYHAQSVAFFRTSAVRLLTTSAVITEVALTLDFSVEAQVDFLNWSHKALEIDDTLRRDLPRIAEVMEKYRDLPADFADASLVVLAERTGVTDIATIDKDFSIYRTKDKRQFRNVFLEP